jgi:hypothetical protein
MSFTTKVLLVMTPHLQMSFRYIIILSLKEYYYKSIQETLIHIESVIWGPDRKLLSQTNYVIWEEDPELHKF